MEKLFSVIIPVYQAKNHLSSCVESILRQTNQDMEIILVDDGSNDGSERMCDAYAEKYDNIHCVHQKNRGVSSARNTGIERAGGKYILFVDSDDYIASDYLENAAAALENSEADLYLCGYQNVKRGGKIKKEKYYPSVKDGIWEYKDISGITLQLFQTNVLHAIGTKVYRREIIVNRNHRFCENRKYFEDIYFCLSYLCFCKQIFVQNKILYFYQRDIENSLSKQLINIDLESVQDTYKLLAKIIRIKSLGEKDKNFFYKLYFDRVNCIMQKIIIAERKYNTRIRRMYRQLAKDTLYSRAVGHLRNFNRMEYFCFKQHLYFCAYLFRLMKIARWL